MHHDSADHPPETARWRLREPAQRRLHHVVAGAWAALCVPLPGCGDRRLRGGAGQRGEASASSTARYALTFAVSWHRPAAGAV